jgi:hypothetical protein
VEPYPNHSFFLSSSEIVRTKSTTMFLTAARKIGSATARRSTALVAAGSRRGFAKEIKFGTEGRAAMLRGVDLLADAVQVSENRL